MIRKNGRSAALTLSFSFLRKRVGWFLSLPSPTVRSAVAALQGASSQYAAKTARKSVGLSGDSSLDARFRIIPFDPRLRAFFVFRNLLRAMVIGGGVVRKVDGMDLCHAVMAGAFSSFATLDLRWKRRVEALPQPNGVARVYGPSELGQMVQDMESWLAHRAA